MSGHEEAAVFHVRATDPVRNEQVAFKCVGFPTAYAKAAELRMNGYKDVITSMAKADDNGTAT